MATWTGVDFLRALKTQLEARAGLTGVTIFTSIPGTNRTDEHIVFHTIRGEQSNEAFAKVRKDLYAVEGFIWIQKPGAGEASAQAAQDRAEAILSQLEDQLTDDEKVNNTVTNAQMSRISLTGGSMPEAEVSQIAFEISVMAIIQPT